jgi:hypothetical protein
VAELYLNTKGMLNNIEKFYLQKYLLERFNLNVLWFKISKEEAKNGFMINSPPLAVTESLSKDGSFYH